MFLADEDNQGDYAVRVIRCIDYGGNEIWSIRAQDLDGEYYRPWGACTDGKQRVFLHGYQSSRVVLVTLPDLTLCTVLQVCGAVKSVTWCAKTCKLYVLHSNSFIRDRLSRFNISS